MRSLPLHLLTGALCASLFACPAASVCGNGTKEAGEECDDGNTTSGDGCEASCRATLNFCGNGKVEGAEACDDGNTTNGDGCQNDCTATPAMGDGGRLDGGATDGGGGVDGGGMDGGGVDGGGSDGGGTDAGGFDAGPDGGILGLDASVPTCGNRVIEAPEECDDGNRDAGDGCENSCRFTRDAGCGNFQLDPGEVCDDGNLDGGDGCEASCGAFTNTATLVGCPGLSEPAPTFGTCTVTPGDSNKLFTGMVLEPGRTLVGGQVLVDATGTITCSGCNCATADGGAQATRVTCRDGVISPGLVNAHDHISFQAPPYVGTDERYEHRNDWRRGNDGHAAINNGGNATNAQIRWAELRQLMSGTTSVVGATFSTIGNQGLLRNLDSAGAGQLGLNGGTVNSDTFPFGDTSGTELTMSCAYPSSPGTGDIPTDSAWLPHVSEGIETSAYNEFRCLSQLTGLLGPRTGLVHGIALKAGDVALVAQTGTSLIWSPRSNVSLYGDTASVPLYSRLGANIAMGTDWVLSGSMNLLRELKCADGLNAAQFDHVLTDAQLWRMVTAGGADATRTSSKVGRIEPGRFADLAIFRKRPGSPYRSVIDAEPADVVMTMRGGAVLYGDVSLVYAFDTQGLCEPLDVCGMPKGACVRAEATTAVTGAEAATNLASLRRANASTYPLFFCSAPQNEPSCRPERAARNVKNGSTTYTAASVGTNDTDGDGVANATDNCPTVFNPVRPMDNGQQANVDGDAQGDACDACPLDANTTTCRVFDPNDLDGDLVPNSMDNCPSDANANQADSDGDQKGDVCDACPTESNPGDNACPSTIYRVKSGTSPVGSAVALGNVLVTAVSSQGFFIQVKETDNGYTGPDNSGAFVFGAATGVTPGMRVNLPKVNVADYFGQIQLSGFAADGGVVVVAAGPEPLPTPVTVPPADVATGGTRARALESVLVRVANVEVLSVTPDAGAGDRAPTNEFVVTGDLRVNDYLYLTSPFPTVGQQFAAITGVLEFRNGNSKLEPRADTDLQLGPPVLSGLEPAQAFLREGTTTVLPGPLRVRLSNAALTDTTVTVSSGGPEVTVTNGMVVVPTGMSAAPVGLTGVTASDAGVVVSATLGAVTKTATVRVLSATQPARLASLTPAMATGAPGAAVRLTVGLDLPAPAPLMATVALSPGAGFGTVPATVTIPQDALSASFDLTLAPTAMGMGTVSVTLGADSRMALVTAAIAPTAGSVVISEFAVLGAGGAADEFIELYNPLTTAVDISGWRVQYKSATGASWSTKVTIPANVSLPPGGYYLIATATAAGAGAKDVTVALDFAAAAGHVRLIDDLSVEQDRVGYGSTANLPEGMVIPTVHGSGGSFERKASAGSTVTSMAAGGTDERAGNGYDTDNNANDFVLRVARDPQGSASPTEP